MTRFADARLPISSTLGMGTLVRETYPRGRFKYAWGWGRFHGSSSRATWTRRFAPPAHCDGS